MLQRSLERLFSNFLTPNLISFSEIVSAGASLRVLLFAFNIINPSSYADDIIFSRVRLSILELSSRPIHNPADLTAVKQLYFLFKSFNKLKKSFSFFITELRKLFLDTSLNTSNETEQARGLPQYVEP